ncbi:hypothetical protein [Streptomyces sp. NPDC049881]|uniref:hypothetical protein n=1 Tax=Streptomyces sp. NPDC049881 TaxID=3155778 RepID=UPI00344A1FDA
MTTTLRPLDVVRAAVAVVAVRGGYRSIRCTDSAQVPTSWEVANYLSGAELSCPEDRERVDAAVARAADTAAAVYAWCVEGAHTGIRYRTKLARLVKSGRVQPGDMTIMASAVAAWLYERHRAQVDAEQALDARRSRHQGGVGLRLSFTADVVAVIPLENRYYGAVVRHATLVKFRDRDGHIYIWQAATDRLPEPNATVEVAGTVKDHTSYKGVAQTKLTYCRWFPHRSRTVLPQREETER